MSKYIVKVNLGTTLITPNAMDNLQPIEVAVALRRHAVGDWGNVPASDREANEQALVESNRLMSVYMSLDLEDFWVITEADRSVTTVLMPEDY